MISWVWLVVTGVVTEIATVFVLAALWASDRDQEAKAPRVYEGTCSACGEPHRVTIVSTEKEATDG